MYQRRVRQVAAGMNARFNERIAERIRLSGELHDTLLQSVQASKMVADSALEDESGDPARMRRDMESLSAWLDQAITEGRTALNALRSSVTQRNDLAEAFERAVENSGLPGSVKFVLSVEGIARETHPIVRDEVYRIGCEAIRNAGLHSGGSELEMNLIYSDNLTLRVRDNGKGIDPEIAVHGKPGRFGLTGMKERATRIGGKLRVFSRPDSGTEVELIVPGRIIFREASALQRSFSAKLREVLRRKGK
jgi:signal transduction histidine kinase